ncbi:DUF2799 domain-containing protein [Flexibacterium corallicola]|uniref:DUF2799 domain-containing protein n=1 Tax=Flexibacterium corallicola TaxID=3037259 RepID=UPI00286EDE01|nr:DUF2799 domain-containing protein [Pseudovibrio sp. M1P-2-3]
MKKISNLISFLAFAFILSACASLSEEDCKAGDWRALGFMDGQKGYEADRINTHSKACGKYGIAPDRAAYSQGRIQGLQSFCTPTMGFEQGSGGKPLRNVCPASSALRFQQGYMLGKQLYDARAQIRQAKADLIKAREGAKEELTLKCESAKDPQKCYNKKSPTLALHADVVFAQAHLMRAELNLSQVQSHVTYQMSSIAPSYALSLYTN